MSDDEIIDKLDAQLEFLYEQYKKNPYNKQVVKEIAEAIAINVNSIRSDDYRRTALLILNKHQFAYGYIQPFMT